MSKQGVFQAVLKQRRFETQSMSTGHRKARSGRIGFTLMAFLAGAAAVYAFTYHRAIQSPDHVACAFVWQRAELGSVEPGKQPPPTAAVIEAEILSDAEQVAGPVAPKDSGKGPSDRDTASGPPNASRAEALTPERGNIHVQVEANQQQGQSLVAIRVTDKDAERAILVANRLAEKYAKDHGAGAPIPRAQEGFNSNAAVEQARQSYLAAREQLDRFLDGYFRQRPTVAEHPIAPEPVQSKPFPIPSATASPPQPPLAGASMGPAPIDNPLWLDLDRRRSELQKRRSQLLVDRTPLHPDVQELDVQIAKLEQRLAQNPRRVVPGTQPTTADREGRRAESLRPENPPQQGPAAPSVIPQGIAAHLRPLQPLDTAPAPNAEAWPGAIAPAHEFLALRERLAQAEKLRDQTLEQDRLVLQRRPVVSTIEVQLADHAELAGLAHEQTRMLTISLAAGLVSAAGMGMFAGGLVRRNQPFSSPRQVEKALSVPVVGVISGSQQNQEIGRRSGGTCLFRSSESPSSSFGLERSECMNPQGPLVPN